MPEALSPIETYRVESDANRIVPPLWLVAASSTGPSRTTVSPESAPPLSVKRETRFREPEVPAIAQAPAAGTSRV